MQTTLLQTNKDCPQTLQQADSKLSALAESKLNSIRFGTEECEKGDFLILNKLREIYEQKLHNHDCYRDYNLADIKSVIQKYL